MAAANSYVQDDTGTYIPATQRPDGSWRKARRVKDGYIPQDEMPLYESKGKQWAKSRPTHPIGLDPKYVAAANNVMQKIPGLSLTENETVPKSKKKKKKKSESQKVDSLANNVANMDISSKALKESTPSSQNSTQNTQITTDPAKRIRNLKKKLRDINALKLKIESGELVNPEKDQLEKVARKGEIEAEIEELELDLELA